MKQYELKHKIQEIGNEIRMSGIDAHSSDITNKDLINWAFQEMFLEKLEAIDEKLDNIRTSIYTGH